MQLAEKIAAFFDPRLQDGKGDKQNMPISKVRRPSPTKSSEQVSGSLCL